MDRIGGVDVLREYGKPWKGDLLEGKKRAEQEAPEERNITRDF
jgi:hypothetical protein